MKELESLFHTYKTAVFEKDLDAFVSIFDDNILVFDMWQQWTFEGLDAWRQMAKGWFESLGSDRDRVTHDDMKIQHNGELAV